jgi:hypothetical protein
MRPADIPVAVICSDLHLCEKPPIARSSEADWFGAMQRPLMELRYYAELWRVPIFYAGDIFDRWNNSSTLVNWVIQNLPKGYAIPGQHDLRYHSYKDISHTSYQTLIHAGVITNLEPGLHWLPIGTPSLLVGSFPWGTELKPIADLDIAEEWKGIEDINNNRIIRIALCHHYVHTIKHKFPGADPSTNAKRITRKLEGFDVLFFGDNHKGFMIDHRPRLINCGGFMRRKIDEVDYQPRFWVLYADKSVRAHRLTTDHELLITMPTRAGDEFQDVANWTGFLDELRATYEVDTVKSYLMRALEKE